MPIPTDTRSDQILRKDGFYVAAFIAGTNAATATNYPSTIFIAKYPCEVVWVAESHDTAGSDAGAVTLALKKMTSGTAIGSGSNILTSDFNLKTTADTPVEKTRGDLQSDNRKLVQGDRLGLVTSGTLTAVSGVNVTIYLKPLGNGDYR